MVSLPHAPSAAAISKATKRKTTIDKRRTNRGQGSATSSCKSTTSQAEEETGEYDVCMNALSSEVCDDEPPPTRMRATSNDEPPTKKRNLVIDEEGLGRYTSRGGRATGPVTTASAAAMLSHKMLDEAAEDRLSKSIAFAMQSARMVITLPPTFDGESDVQRDIDEARLYIEQFPN